MITIRYQYPGDPVSTAQLLFGAEFQARNPNRYIAVIAGGTETRIPIPPNEIVCDQCNGDVSDVDPCINTDHSLYCWTCGHEQVLRHRVPDSTAAEQPVPRVFLAIRKATDDGHVFPDVDSASGDPAYALTKSQERTQSIPQYAKANPIVGVAQFDHVATHYI